MVDAFRSMLDELMGKERDVPLDKRQNRGLLFDDKDVCKYELVGLCPNRLFRNTKSDLGSCGYEIHDDHLEWANVKEQWDKLSQREKDGYPFERDLLRYMEQLIRDMDGKIRKNKERADAESRPKVLKLDDQKRLDDMKARQAELVARAAQLGEAGDVDGALLATQSADSLGKQYDALHKQLTEPERFMTVCDICGVFINSTDNEQRRLTPGELKAREDHLTGKQYLGWKKIRETYAELVKAREDRLRGGGRGGPPPGGVDSSRVRSRSRDEPAGDRQRGSSSRERERERDRSRGYSGGGGSRDRDYRGGGRDDYDRDYRDSRYDYGRRERDRSPRRRSDGGYRDRGYGERDRRY